MSFLFTETIRTENVYSVQLILCPVLLKLSREYLTSATTTDQDSRQKRGCIITVMLCLILQVHRSGKLAPVIAELFRYLDWKHSAGVCLLCKSQLSLFHQPEQPLTEQHSNLNIYTNKSKLATFSWNKPIHGFSPT